MAVVWTLCAASLLDAAAAAAPQSFLLSVYTDPYSQSQTSEVSCNDRVFAFLRLSEPVSGSHLLEGRWYRPDGSQQEYTRLPLLLEGRAAPLLHLWLEFERRDASPGLFELLYSGVGDATLDGPWTLDVFWDGEKVGTARFRVHCT